VTTAPKVSTCVDCATALIGDILRCGSCQERHDAARTVRPRPDGDDVPNVYARWVVTIELLVIVTLGLVFAMRGCPS
jgi:hypothetical protein